MKCKAVIAIVLGLMCTNVLAQEQLGLGLIVGEPTGLSVKYWLDKEHALDGAVAWSFWDDDGLQLHADYLWHLFDLLDESDDEGRLPVYFGLGGRLKFKDDDEGRWHNDDDDVFFGIRVPLGISYMLQDPPIDVFVEIAPVLDVVPDVELDLNLALGLRFYVK